MATRWPSDWDERKRGKDCPMCAEGRPDDNGFGIRIHAGAFADAYLQRADVGQPGYTLVIWRGRHVSEPTELTSEEASGYFAEVLNVARALATLYRPIKMNIEMLGNSLPHLHTHVVPRYSDDGSPGHPPRFMRMAEADHRRRDEDVVLREAQALRELVRSA